MVVDVKVVFVKESLLYKTLVVLLLLTGCEMDV